MDAEIEALIRELPADVQEWIRLIQQGQIPQKDLGKLLVTLIKVVNDRAKLMKLLTWLARQGLISARAIQQAMSAAIAEESAGAGGAAAGLSLGAILSILLAVLAVIFAAYRIYTVDKEAHGTPPLPPSGAPCPGSATAATQEYAVTGRSMLGGVAAWENAMKKARNECARHAADCTGECLDPAVIKVD